MSNLNNIPKHQLEHWQLFSKNLLQLHKICMEWQFGETEKVRGPITHPNARLQLLLSDDEFQWFRWMSQLVTQVDHILDSKKPIDPTQWLQSQHEWVSLFEQKTGIDFQQKIQKVQSIRPETIAHFQLLVRKIKDFTIKS